MLSVTRQQKILDELHVHGVVKVSSLSTLLQVTEKTVREDLERLEQRRLLKRIHGGAVVLSAAEANTSFEPKIPNTLHSEEKERIAAYAVEHWIQSGDIIALDAGSTTMEIAKKIKDYSLTVVTNDIMIIHELALAKNIKLVVPGGYSQNNLLIHHEPIAWIQQLNIHKCFLSTTGIHPEYGLTVFSSEQIGLKKTFIDLAEKVICIADHSKYDRGNLHTFASIKDIDCFITDSNIPQDILSKFRKWDTPIQLA